MLEIPDNAWAFLLFILAAAIAFTGHFGKDKDLLQFASTVAMTAAAIFHSKERKE